MKGPLGDVRRRRALADLGVLLLAAVVLFVSLQHEGALTLAPAFFLPIDPTGGSYRNGAAVPDWTERAPAPVITDLEGDGEREIVLATREPTLKIVKYLPPHQAFFLVQAGAARQAQKEFLRSRMGGASSKSDGGTRSPDTGGSHTSKRHRSSTWVGRILGPAPADRNSADDAEFHFQVDPALVEATAAASLGAQGVPGSGDSGGSGSGSGSGSDGEPGESPTTTARRNRDRIVASALSARAHGGGGAGAGPGGGYSVAVITREVSLLDGVGSREGRQVIALGTGYLEPYSATRPRRQAIVAVTADWSVLCFDHKLRLRWEHRVPESLRGRALADVAIYVGAHDMRVGDRGVVVVGGRATAVHGWTDYGMHHEAKHAHAATATADGTDPDTDPDSVAGSAAEGPETLERGGDRFDREEHFSFFAFDGATGAERWHHAAGDFHDAPEGADVLRPQHDAHQGEVEWVRFRYHLLKALPHVWRGPQDSSLAVAHFATKRAGVSHGRLQRKAAERAARWASDLASFAGLAAPVLQPHSEGEHVRWPNTLVARLRDGIEVVHLYTGQTVTRLALKRGALHVDVNGDGVIDHVEPIGALPLVGVDDPAAAREPNYYRGPRCRFFVSSGIPPLHRLFNGSLCLDPRGQSLTDAALVGGRVAEDRVVVAAPIALPHPTAPGARPLADLLFLTNLGHVSAYGPEGSWLWTTHTKAAWLPDTRSAIDSDREQAELLFTPMLIPIPVYDERALPSLALAEAASTASASATPATPGAPAPATSAKDPLRANSREGLLGRDKLSSAASSRERQAAVPNVLAVGRSSVVLLAPDGEVLSEAPLPDLPVGAHAVGDFTNDGANDLLLVTVRGVYGYRVGRAVGTRIFSAVAGLLILFLAGMLVFNLASTPSTHAAAASVAAAAASTFAASPAPSALDPTARDGRPRPKFTVDGRSSPASAASSASSSPASAATVGLGSVPATQPGVLRPGPYRFQAAPAGATTPVATPAGASDSEGSSSSSSSTDWGVRRYGGLSAVAATLTSPPASSSSSSASSPFIS